MFLLHFSRFKTFLFFGHSKIKVRSCVLCVYAGTPLKVGYFFPIAKRDGDIIGNIPHRATTGPSAIMAYRWGAGCGQLVCGSWDISFGVNTFSVCEAFFPPLSLLNQIVDFDQTCIDTLFGGGKKLI